MGGILTILGFYFTASPTTSEEIKEHLLLQVESDLMKKYEGDSLVIIADKHFIKELDVSSEKSIFVLGKGESENEKFGWIAIFENQKPNVVDKLIGRSGKFLLSSMSSFEIYADDVFFKKIESLDLDNDGTSEVHIKIKEQYADSTAIGPLVYKKSKSGNWTVLTLPTTESQIKKIEYPTKIGLSPITHFGIVGDEASQNKILSTLKMREMYSYEQENVIDHNGEDIFFTTYRNGGDYRFTQHSVKGYSQIQTLSFFADGNAVLAPHYAITSVYRIYEESVVLDPLWNWGFPMFSTRSVGLTELDWSSLLKGGILAHTVGDTFYGYTEFEKIKPEQ